MTTPRLIPGLTLHQAIIAHLVADGWTNAEIAAQIGSREKTVKAVLRRRIYARLGLSNRQQLAYLVLTGQRPPSARRVPEAADA